MVFSKIVNSEYFMSKALTLAARARGMTSPNPMVGAVLVRRGRIISEGYHKKAGTPHAEAIAIEKAKGGSRGATLYVTLEPCCHLDKRTPPCTEKIISSGIRKVVVAMKDPNPKVAGKGIEALQRAGIEVACGLMEEKAERLNESYIKYITTRMPFVTLKVAMTLDGKIATPGGESKWITGEEARKLVHKMRGSADALLTAIGTIKADNPRLTCRTGRGRSPVRVVIDPDLELGMDSCVLKVPPETILVIRSPEKGSAAERKKNILALRGINILEFGGAKVRLEWLMKELGKREITSVLVEGGSSLNSYCLESGTVDKVMFFIAPKIIGGRESFPAVGGKTFRKLSDAFRVEDVTVRRVGRDILIEGYLRKRS